MATKTKTKTPALQIHVPATRDECAARIKQLGDLHRQHALRKAELDGKIAALQDEYAPVLNGLADQVGAMHQGIQIWAEAHRAALTQDGKVKTAQLVTGELQWRQRPPSVALKAVDTVLAALKALGLGQYVRTTEEVNKQALLELDAGADKISAADVSDEARTLREHLALVRTVKGITIVKGVEDFSVIPFETEAATATA